MLINFFLGVSVISMESESCNFSSFTIKTTVSWNAYLNTPSSVLNVLHFICPVRIEIKRPFK